MTTSPVPGACPQSQLLAVRKLFLFLCVWGGGGGGESGNGANHVSQSENRIQMLQFDWFIQLSLLKPDAARMLKTGSASKVCATCIGASPPLYI